MGKEIQLKGLAQQRVVEIEHCSAGRGAGIGNEDIEPAEMLHGSLHGGLRRTFAGDVGGEACVPVAQLGQCRVQTALVEIDQQTLSPLRGEGPGGRQADRPGAAGHHNDLALEERWLAFAELDLFERPVFALELVLFAQRIVAAGILAGRPYPDVLHGKVGRR